MKKIVALAAAGALALSSTPAMAGPDTGEPLPGPDEILLEFAKTLCNLTGASIYCDYVEKHAN